MSHEDVEVRPGQRVSISVLGKERCPRLKSNTGVIVSRSGRSSVRVLLDGRKHPVTLHLSYVECDKTRGFGSALANAE
jgi:hypothetical protein